MNKVPCDNVYHQWADLVPMALLCYQFTIHTIPKQAGSVPLPFPRRELPSLYNHRSSPLHAAMCTHTLAILGLLPGPLCSSVLYLESVNGRAGSSESDRGVDMASGTV